MLRGFSPGKDNADLFRVSLVILRGRWAPIGVAVGVAAPTCLSYFYRRILPQKVAKRIRKTDLFYSSSHSGRFRHGTCLFGNFCRLCAETIQHEGAGARRCYYHPPETMLHFACQPDSYHSLSPPSRHHARRSNSLVCPASCSRS